MKIKITMKDPDGFEDSLNDAVKESVAAIPGLSEIERESVAEKRKDEVREALRTWFRYSEYVTLEIDTDAKTARVCKVNET